MHYESTVSSSRPASSSAPTTPAGRDSTRSAAAAHVVGVLGRGHAQHARHPCLGFPNLFIVGPTQGANLISNVTHNLTEAGATIAAVIAHALAPGPTRSRSRRTPSRRGWSDSKGARSVSSAIRTARPATTTTKASRSAAGNGSTSAAIRPAPSAFFEYIDAWRSGGRFEGLTFRGDDALRRGYWLSTRATIAWQAWSSCRRLPLASPRCARCPESPARRACSRRARSRATRHTVGRWESSATRCHGAGRTT